MSDLRLPFDADTYAARRRRLAEKLESGLVLLLGNGRSAANYGGNPYPFRQDSTFLYFAGLDRPGVDLVIDADAGRATLFGEDPSLDNIVWDGPQPSIGEQAARAGIEETALPEALVAVVDEARKGARDVHMLPPYREAHRCRLGALLDVPPGATDERASERLIRAVVAQREAKTDAEVAEIETALRTTRQMHLLAMRETKPGAVEQEVAGRMEGIARAAGGETAFSSIFSTHGEIFHNSPSERRLEDGALALCDAGGTAPSHYAGDITRTTPVSGSFSEKQRAVYEIVLEAQEAAIEATQPGATFKDVHVLAARRLAAGLKEIGLMTGDPGEAVAEGAHALFFPHGLGHMLGLDAHDMEALGEDYVGYDDPTVEDGVQRSYQFGLNALRLGRKLKPGFVLTVEPGCYFIPPLIEQWRSEGRHADFIDYDAVEGYEDFGGIRIEDDVLVTADGPQVLGEPIPKQPGEVEALAGRTA
jgi:Xaa-Pro aminopeptidase